MNDPRTERKGERDNNKEESNNRKPSASRGDPGDSGSGGKPTQNRTAMGPTLLTKSFISETTENAGNVLMIQKLETAQTIKSLSHTRDPTDRTVCLHRHDSKRRKGHCWDI